MRARTHTNIHNNLFHCKFYSSEGKYNRVWITELKLQTSINRISFLIPTFINCLFTFSHKYEMKKVLFWNQVFENKFRFQVLNVLSSPEYKNNTFCFCFDSLSVFMSLMNINQKQNIEGRSNLVFWLGNLSIWYSERFAKVAIVCVQDHLNKFKSIEVYTEIFWRELNK